MPLLRVINLLYDLIPITKQRKTMSRRSCRRSIASMKPSYTSIALLSLDIRRRAGIKVSRYFYAGNTEKAGRYTKRAGTPDSV